MLSGRYSSTLIVCQGAISRENAIVRPLNFRNVLQSRLSRAYENDNNNKYLYNYAINIQRDERMHNE